AAAPSRLAGCGADAAGRLAALEAPDRVRLRRDRGSAARGGRRKRRDQRAAVSVPQGNHGGEEKALRHVVSRRSRGRPWRGGRGRVEDRGARPRRAAVARRRAQDRGRRQRGAARVHVAEDDSLEPPLPQARVDVLAKIVQDGGYDTVLFANSVLAADLAAGLAARLDAGLNWDLTDIELRDGTLVGKRPALQDSILVDVGWKTTPRLALFLAGSFDATPNE